MAEAPSKTLIFETAPEGAAPGCADCAERRVNLPAPLPAIPDDFDWLVRDYDSFRLFMMEELAHRFPERKRWAPADVEVVIVELLASQFDRLSHALDVVHAERFLATARRPESLRHLLSLIGYDAVARTPDQDFERLPPAPDALVEETPEQRLDRLWTLFPQKMEAARRAGPRQIGEQHRMVTPEDHEERITSHPLCERAQARQVWTGAWNTILISVLLDEARLLDEPLHTGAEGADWPNGMSQQDWQVIAQWHRDEDLPLPEITTSLTRRTILRILVDRYRMIGTEVFLENARQVPLTFALSIKARPGYFRSELKNSVLEVLSTDPGGLFEPGTLGFGEDVYASNIIEAVMQVDGVQTACLNWFKRLGNMWPDQTDAGKIEIAADEIAVCQNAPAAPELGGFTVKVVGGEVG